MPTEPTTTAGVLVAVNGVMRYDLEPKPVSPDRLAQVAAVLDWA